jgi:hypothetical protein
MTLNSEELTMDTAWKYIWSKLFYPKTNLFYDCLTDHPTDPLCGYLPTPEEIAHNFPNACSWNTGMEDSMLNAGPALLMIIDRWEVTRDESLRELAAKVFSGMKHCATISGLRGFLARSVSPVDGKSFYWNSSRDQYTLFIYSAWKFYYSGLSSNEQREDIRQIIADFAYRCESCVTEANNYELLRFDNKSGLVCQMWGNIEEHEILRLPMFYGAAWNLTGEKHWFDLYRRYVKHGQEFAATIKHPKFPGFALLQMQVSQRLLWEIEPDAAVKGKYAEIMRITADIAIHCMHESERLYRELNGFIGHFNKDWRRCQFDYLGKHPISGLIYTKALIPQDYRNSMIAAREPGEGIMIQLLCPGYHVSENQKERFSAATRRIDYECHASCGPILQLAAYWALQRAALPAK